jgi:parvulin-like peptidyl-prolyl isomerase
MNRMRPRKDQGALAPESIDELKKKAVDRLIFQELAYQEGKALGLQPDKEKIDAAVADLRNKLGEDQYKKFLEMEGLSEEELRTQVDRSLTLEGVYAREVVEKSVVPEDELRKEYEQEKDKFFNPEKVLVDDVVFFLKTDDPDSEKKAEEVLAKIKEDKDQDPWNLVLDGTFIVREYEVKKDRDPELYDEAKKLKKGELSGVIKTPDSFHIMKLKEYTPEKQITFEEAKGYLEERGRKQAQRKRMDEWKAELMAKAKIETFETPSGSIKTNQ